MTGSLFPDLRPHRADARDDLDRYYTPDALARALVQVLPLRRDRVVLEPSAGGGAFVKALANSGHTVLALDADPTAPGRLRRHAVSWDTGDFLRWDPPERVDAIVGNPPYADAEAHVRRALSVTGRHVAFLLRLAFLESAGRVPFWREFPCRKVWVLAERPSFTGGSTDSAAYGWFWWDLQHDGPTEMEVLSWR